MSLRETVAVVTPAGRLTGHLFVGADGLPELCLEQDVPYGLPYRPATFSATWRLSSPTCGELYQAWLDVERVQRQLAVAQREAGGRRTMPTVNGLKVTGPDGTLLGWQAECPLCGEQVRYVATTIEQPARIEGWCEHYQPQSEATIFSFKETMPQPEDELTAYKRHRALEEEHGR